LLITLAIYAILGSAGVDGEKFGGGAQAPLWLLLYVGISTLTATFPFSQAMSVTRREFYLGSLLTASLTSAMLAILFVVGGLVEEATNGWGMNGYFFALTWVWDAGPLVAGLFYFVLAMMFFVIGFATATIFKRFGTMGVTVVLIGIGLLLVAGLWLVGQANAWVDLFLWFADLGSGGLTLLMTGVTVVLAVVAFPVLRRAVP
jgi:hypothetical protein